jgi:RimJ/RimL family protein N-acetyltransferase
VRDRAEPDLAEVAFEVVDDWHGRGVGTLLVRRLARRARALRSERFRGFVLGTNERAKAVLLAGGRVAGSRLEGSAVELLVELA